MKRYPFKFLEAYTRDDRDFFFGRNEEIEELYEMVFQSDLLIVQGPSGAGKSSLIQCGLAGKFQSHDWLALNIRRGADLNESLAKALDSCAGDAGADDLDWLADDLSAPAPAAALSPLARRFKNIYLRYFKPLYLIFDQFEELYTLGNKAEQQTFIRTVQDILRVEQPVKIILSIREEYLGHLYEFERQVPELTRKKLRVEPMNLERVQRVILGVGSRPDSNVRLQTGEEAAIAQGIFERIRGKDTTLHIQLPYLQVFLDKFYLHCTGDENRQAEALFTLEKLADMGELGDVLRNFLEDQVLYVAQKLEQQPDTLWQLLSPFVTLEGTKEPLSEAELSRRLPDYFPGALIAPALQTFVERRVLRLTENEQRYEIAHDSLAKQLADRRDDDEIALLEVQRLIRSQAAIKKVEKREYFSPKQLDFMTPLLPKLRLTDEERDWVRQSEQHRQAMEAAGLQKQRQELEKARQQAEQEKQLRTQAEQAKNDAEHQREQAEAARMEAEKQRIHAEQSRNEAEAARSDAEKQRGIAECNEADARVSEKRARQRTRAAFLLAFLAFLAGGFALLQYLQVQEKNKTVELERNKAADERDKAKEALIKFQKAEAEKILLEVDDILKRSDRLAIRHPDEAERLRGEAKELLSKYPDNPILKDRLEQLNR